MKKNIIFLIFFMINCWICGQTREQFIKTEIIKANNFISNQETRKFKFESMTESPFTFYRATAHLFYKDIGQRTIHLPSILQENRKINTWIQGDAHIQNVGYMYNGRELIFDLNDFDEAFIAPFYWDIIRFITSIFLIRNELDCNFNEREIAEECLLFVERYKEFLNTLRFSNKEIDTYINVKTSSGFIQKKFKSISDNEPDKILKKWTLANTGTFDFSNQKLLPVSEKSKQKMNAYWHTYLKSIPDTYSKYPNYFKIKDQAIRINSGLGSLGVAKYYLLIEGKSSINSDDILLEVKEQQYPSMIIPELKNSKNNYDSLFENHAQRVFVSQKALCHSLNFHSGILSSDKNYTVKRKSSYQKSFEGKHFNKKKEFSNFLEHVAQVYAYAHSRGDWDYDKKYVGYSFEENAYMALDAIELSTLVFTSKKYFSQVKADYKIFCNLINNGEIK